MEEMNMNNQQQSINKGGTINEEDVCYLLQRYPAMTILLVLREVAQTAEEVKLNWNVVFNKLSTITNSTSNSNNSTGLGIKNPRELQLLWRHLAYRHPLKPPVVDDDSLSLITQVQDDDSDLDYEVEAFPPVSTEVATEAANCVKVLACGSANDPAVPNSTTVEGDMHNGLLKSSVENSNAASVLPSSNGPLPVPGKTEAVDANGLANNLRKKRKWTEEEDLKLAAGVRTWGEGNWAAILKEDSNWARTAGQLSQRWTNMKRRGARPKDHGEVGSPGSHLTSAQLATRRALDMALMDTSIAVGNGAAGGSKNTAKPPTINKEPPVSSVTVPSQKQPAQVTNASVKPAPLSSLSKARPALKKAPSKPPSVSDPIQRAAVAAGARIAGPPAAVALHEQVISSGFQNVHFIRTGLTATAAGVAAGSASVTIGGQQAKGSAGTASLGTGGQQDKGSTGIPSVPSPAASHLSRARSMPTVVSEQNTVPATELKKQDNKTLTEVNSKVSVRKTVVGVPENNASFRNPFKAPPVKDRSTSASVSGGGNKETAAAAGDLQNATSKDIALNEHTNVTSKQVTMNPVPMDVDENLSVVLESCLPIVSGKSELLANSVVESTEKKGVVN